LELGDRPAGETGRGRATIAPDWSRMCSRAPAICCVRIAAPSRESAISIEASRGRGRADCRRTVERHGILRLAGEAGALADRQPLGRDQCDDRGAVLLCEDRDVFRGCGQTEYAAPGRAACHRRRSLMLPSSCTGATVIGPRRRADPGLRQPAIPPSMFRRAAPARAKRPATRNTAKPSIISAPAPPRLSGTHVKVRPDSSSAFHSSSGQRPSSAALTVCGSHRSAKMRVAVSDDDVVGHLASWGGFLGARRQANGSKHAPAALTSAGRAGSRRKHRAHIPARHVLPLRYNRKVPARPGPISSAPETTEKWVPACAGTR